MAIENTARPASPILKSQDGTVSWTHREGDQYLITGTDRDGRRFQQWSKNWLVIKGVNIYRGRRWLVRDGRRHLIEEVWN